MAELLKNRPKEIASAKCSGATTAWTRAAPTSPTAASRNAAG
jgi:hypothetical protein